jgi:putative oxidoreductase
MNTTLITDHSSRFEWGRQAIAALIILLFVYAATFKLLDYQNFRGQLGNQHIPSGLAPILAWLLPGMELAACGLLLYPSTRWMGFALAAFLMAVFTIYVALIMLHVWSRVPCPCGGIISLLSWRSHLILNSVFLALATCGLALSWPPGEGNL